MSTSQNLLSVGFETGGGEGDLQGSPPSFFPEPLSVTPFGTKPDTPKKPIFYGPQKLSKQPVFKKFRQIGFPNDAQIAQSHLVSLTPCPRHLV